MKLVTLMKTHKIATAIILVIISFVGNSVAQSFNDETGVTEIITEPVEKGTLITSVSGAGQVSNVSRVDLTAKASGDVVRVSVENGEEVVAGTVLVQLNTTDVNKAIRDAETNLESAELSLQKLLRPADDLAMLQSENAIFRAEESLQDAEEDLEKAYDDAYNEVSDAFLDLPAIMTGLEDILYGSAVNGSQSDIDAYPDLVKKYNKSVLDLKTDVLLEYDAARVAYTSSFAAYSVVNRSSANDVIEELASETYDAAVMIGEAVKRTKNLVDFVEDILTVRSVGIPNSVATHRNTLNSYTASLNSIISSLYGAVTDIPEGRESVLSAGRDFAEKNESHEKLEAGPDALDIKSSELTIRQRENSLRDARERYSDYVVTAPFAGIVANVNVRVGESVGSSTTAITLITTQKIAEIFLNEVDVAAVKRDQKATLEFDAIEGFSVTGTVAEIDTLASVQQGVVTYGVKIAFDTDDERILPDMSVSASIITNIKTGVLLVPNAAVKTRGNSIFVEVQKGDGSLVQITVEIGSFNDEKTEILSGVDEGDEVVVRKVEAASDQPQGGSLFPSPGRGFGGAPH